MTELTNFNQLKNMFLNIQNNFNNINQVKIKLKNIYNEYILKYNSENNENENNNILLFSLDALHFQNLLIELEYSNIEKNYQLLNNKIYCEYYKLYKIITKFSIKYSNDTIIEILKHKYPSYKDLEPYKIYNFQFINQLNNDIIHILDELSNILLVKQQQQTEEENKSQNGLNIDKYVYTLNYNNNLLEQNIILYKKYLQTFNTYHITYLTRLNIKSKMILDQLNMDVKLLINKE
jgi:hypothetical protein